MTTPNVSHQVIDHIRSLRTETLEMIKAFNLIVMTCEDAGFKRATYAEDMLSGIEELRDWLASEFESLAEYRNIAVDRQAKEE